MDTWTELYIVLGKIFVVVLVGVIVGLIMYGIGKWLDKSDEEPKQTKPIDGTNWLNFNTYDSEGRIKQKGDELRKITNKNRRLRGYEINRNCKENR
jgi:hypothetical protein